MAAGFAAAMRPEELQIVVNVGDDFVFCGLHISPDLDTVVYTLAGAHDVQRGWGLRDETWIASRRMAELGGPSWFQLGDRDIATHLARTALLSEGQSLSAVTAKFRQACGVVHQVVPVTDMSVRTQIRTDAALLDFQDYFVRLRAEPLAREILYSGAENASLTPQVQECLEGKRLEAVIFAPSNPWLSIAPMLATGEMKARLAKLKVPIVAISPIVAGRAIKGPAAKIMKELGYEVSAFGVAQYYSGLITHFVIDGRDIDLSDRIEALGIQVFVTDIMIPSIEAQRRLADELLALVPATIHI